MRVLPDVPAIDKTFDYLVDDRWVDQIRVGTIVRVALHGRRVRGWVVAVDVEPPPGRALTKIAKVTGWGPAPDLVDLASWAAWRWCGRPAQLLRTASPETAVHRLPPAAGRGVPVTAPASGQVDELAATALARPRAVVRLAPAVDPYPLVLAACARGNSLILVPNAGTARHLGLRLRRAGVAAAVMPKDWGQAAAGASVIGTRAAAWAPVRDLAAVVVLDEHDEVWQQERAPTWHARDVVVERAARAGVPCVLVSPAPTLEALDLGPLVVASRSAERDGWPIVDVVDRRSEDIARSGLFSERLVQTLRSDRRVVCVLNRKGRSSLLACVRCGETARCERCDAAVTTDDDHLRCRRCETARPKVCLACGGTVFRNLRPGVSRVREELEALAREPVVEVSADTGGPPGEARILVGTEAVLHRVDRADVVVFLDLDQELLAPHYRAAEEAFGLLARAARLVGGRRGGGRLLLQTRLPGHEVCQGALLADPGRVASVERERRRLLGYPPFGALVAVSGAVAGELVERFGHPDGVEVLGPSNGQWLLRSDERDRLLDALAATPRPHGRVRVAVDPLRI